MSKKKTQKIQSPLRVGNAVFIRRVAVVVSAVGGEAGARGQPMNVDDKILSEWEQMATDAAYPWYREPVDVASLIIEVRRLRARVRELEVTDDAATEELELLVEDITEHLPSYVLDDGTDEPANARETVEYAGDELKRLAAENARLREVVDAVRAECAKFSFPDEDRPGLWTALSRLDSRHGSDKEKTRAQIAEAEIERLEGLREVAARAKADARRALATCLDARFDLT